MVEALKSEIERLDSHSAESDNDLDNISAPENEEIQALESTVEALRSKIERLAASSLVSASEKEQIWAFGSMIEALKSEVQHLTSLAAESDKDAEIWSKALSLNLQALQSEVEDLKSDIEGLKEDRAEEHNFLPTSTPSARPTSIPSPAPTFSPTSKPPTLSKVTALGKLSSTTTAGPTLTDFTSDSTGCKDVPLSIGCQAENGHGTVMDCEQLQFATIEDDFLRIKWTYSLTNNCPHPRMLAWQYVLSCSLCMPSSLECTKESQVFSPRPGGERYFTLQPYEIATEIEEEVVLLNSPTQCMYSRRVLLEVQGLGHNVASFTIDLKHAWVSPTGETQTVQTKAGKGKGKGQNQTPSPTVTDSASPSATVSYETSEPSTSKEMGLNINEVTEKVVKVDEEVDSPTASPVPSNPPTPTPTSPDDCECIQCYIGTDAPSASPSISLQPTATGKGRKKKISFGKGKSKGPSCAELEPSCDYEDLCHDYCFAAPSAAPSISSEPSVSMFPSTSPSMSSEPSSGKGVGKGVSKGVGKGGKGKGGSSKVR